MDLGWALLALLTGTALFATFTTGIAFGVVLERRKRWFDEFQKRNRRG